jgi:hypothetical protein
MLGLVAVPVPVLVALVADRNTGPAYASTLAVEMRGRREGCR